MQDNPTPPRFETDTPVMRAPPDDAPRSPDPVERPRARGARRLVGLGVLSLVVLVLAYGAWRQLERDRTVTVAAEHHRAAIPAVHVDAVLASSAMLDVTLPATTIAFSTASIYARASGYVERRVVDIGSQVKAGDLLAQITAPELDHQIAQAEASLAQFEATLRQTEATRELARVTSARSGTLAPAGYATQQQADQDRLNYRAQQQAASAAEASIAAQRAQVMVLRQQKTYQQVVAPFDGVVTQRNIDVGSLVQADAASGTAMFAMVHSDVIRVQLYVPQDAAFGLAPGVGAVIHVPEVPDRSFRGTVTRIADALQPGSRTLLTEIDVPNPDGVLTPGIYCTVSLQIPRRVPSLIVPASSIIFNAQGLQVGVVENGTMHVRKVSVVRDLGTSIEVSDGVKSGDMVVLNPSIDLSDGSEVQVQPDRAP
jgi:RND family efflux transporter MFP subunit